MHGFLGWWDGVELWLSGLPFVLQTVAVMPVVLVLAYVIAVVFDGLLGQGIQLMRRARPRSQAPASPWAALSPGGDEGPE